MPGDPPGVGREQAGLRRAQGLEAAAARGLRDSALHGGAADAAARAAGRDPRPDGQDHGQRQGHALPAGQGQPAVPRRSAERCHSDQALALLDDASEREREILGAIEYQANDTVLHTDASLLPRRRKAWAAWNAYLPADPARACTVSYCMNQLQGLAVDTPLVVTLNRSEDIDPATILVRRAYQHPVYTHAAVAAQARKHEIQGVHRTWFAGAYWGWGFHEDGIRSGVEVARALGVGWSEAARGEERIEPAPLEAAA